MSQIEQRVNEEIRAREVRVILPDGEQLGILPIHEALRAARERGLDLVEVAPQAKPPVCKIMDYSKWKYDQAKKLKEAKKKQRTQDVKEIKMRPSIDEHDFNVKARACERFLTDGDKVKATIMFRGRELAHIEIGQKVLERLLERVKEICVVERPPRIEGRNMIMVLAPSARKPEPDEER
ncbi:MAG: translation initiation factor IF-3 [Candidatus Fermentithermobacillus carboniphilus]|uniref:Translation initiation factor IF-3 n=1 Tax=Candidatus Fermentithermobacillus carboniphilus TaxID=3085328 RepID=A0AAT9LGM7_9FIRM|nr:MAG: translation initiation factor IF-3 [Candidatus Fermentithermobacillus carboniphilus]